jgi:magnesium chelatase family protein
MIGPPGTGKTMLAVRLPGLLPALTSQAALEIATIRSVANQPWIPTLWRTPPFRAPHHTASAIAIIGGGAIPRPGEVSLAHHGVLFLDELPEFDRRVLEVLREPLENHRVTISRAAKQTDFPADFQFVAAMNPCPCGYAGDPAGRCCCSGERIAKYLSRVSGPLLDRIDIQLEVVREHDWLRGSTKPAAESSAVVQARVRTAREGQLRRQGCLNSRLGPAELSEIAPLDRPGQKLLEQAFTRFNLSPRTYHRLLKMARTIADLNGMAGITRQELAEALSLRRLELRPHQDGTQAFTAGKPLP